MTESKIELTHRLQREDRWAVASRFKDDHITKLRAEGKPRKDAQQAAWEEMETQFPPLEVTPQFESGEDTPTAWAEHWDDASDDFIGDAQWVYGRLGMPDVQPEDAPSAGACCAGPSATKTASSSRSCPSSWRRVPRLHLI
jgi:hypothetical protein